MNIPRVGGRHWNFYIASAAGIVAAVVTLLFAPALFPAAAASLFSLAYLVLTLMDMPKLTPAYLRKHAGEEDAPPLIVFLLTIGVVIYVTAALFVAVNEKSPNPLHLWLGGISVFLAWLMIHVMWGMHYAWEYYEAPRKGAKGQQRGGLEFPGDDDPDGMAFVYFSLVIAMTAQTSDTDVTDNKMRRIVTAQSLFGYLFNTVAVAAAVNIVVQLSSQAA